jgi:hypothetical protein
MFPQQGWGQSYDFQGQDPMGMAQAMQTMQELGELDQLENLMKNATNPAALAEADMDRVRDLLGDDAAKSLERLAELTKMLEESGLIQQKEGKLELTPRGLRKIASNSLRDLFSKLAKDTTGQHAISKLGFGHERTYETKPYEFGDPFQLDLERTIRNAIRRNGPSTPVKLSPDDFEIQRTEHLTRSSTVLMLDLSMSMPMRDNFLPAKKVAMALHALITSQFPRDFMGIVGRTAPRGELGLRVRHEHAPRLHARAKDAVAADRHEADHHDHRWRADGAHHAPRRRLLQLPARAGNHRGHPPRSCPVHARRHPHQHLHARRGLRLEVLRRAIDGGEPWSSVLHEPREPRRLRARRLHRAQAAAGPRSRYPTLRLSRAGSRELPRHTAREIPPCAKVM